MNYYQITADIEDLSSAEEDQDDEPNWLMTCNHASSRPVDLKSSCSSSAADTTAKAPEGHHVVVVSRPKKAEKRHQHRLSRIWDGVIASYMNGGEANADSSSNDELARMPSRSKVNKDQEDLIASRITELFQSLELEDSSHNEQQLVLRGRNSVGPQQRQRKTVSGYFNDWAKWLTAASPEDNPKRLSTNNNG